MIKQEHEDYSNWQPISASASTCPPWPIPDIPQPAPAAAAVPSGLPRCGCSSYSSDLDHVAAGLVQLSPATSHDCSDACITEPHLQACIGLSHGPVHGPSATRTHNNAVINGTGDPVHGPSSGQGYGCVTGYRADPIQVAHGSDDQDKNAADDIHHHGSSACRSKRPYTSHAEHVSKPARAPYSSSAGAAQQAYKGTPQQQGASGPAGGSAMGLQAAGGHAGITANDSHGMDHTKAAKANCMYYLPAHQLVKALGPRPPMLLSINLRLQIDGQLLPYVYRSLTIKRVGTRNSWHLLGLHRVQEVLKMKHVAFTLWRESEDASGTAGAAQPGCSTNSSNSSHGGCPAGSAACGHSGVGTQVVTQAVQCPTGRQPGSGSGSGVRNTSGGSIRAAANSHRSAEDGSGDEPWAAPQGHINSSSGTILGNGSGSTTVPAEALQGTCAGSAPLLTFLLQVASNGIPWTTEFFDPATRRLGRKDPQIVAISFLELVFGPDRPDVVNIPVLRIELDGVLQPWVVRDVQLKLQPSARRYRGCMPGLPVQALRGYYDVPWGLHPDGSVVRRMVSFPANAGGAGGASGPAPCGASNGVYGGAAAVLESLEGRGAAEVQPGLEESEARREGAHGAAQPVGITCGVKVASSAKTGAAAKSSVFRQMLLGGGRAEAPTAGQGSASGSTCVTGDAMDVDAAAAATATTTTIDTAEVAGDPESELFPAEQAPAAVEDSSAPAAAAAAAAAADHTHAAVGGNPVEPLGAAAVASAEESASELGPSTYQYPEMAVPASTAALMLTVAEPACQHEDQPAMAGPVLASDPDLASDQDYHSLVARDSAIANSPQDSSQASVAAPSNVTPPHPISTPSDAPQLLDSVAAGASDLVRSASTAPSQPQSQAGLEGTVGPAAFQCLAVAAPATAPASQLAGSAGLSASLQELPEVTANLKHLVAAVEMSQALLPSQGACAQLLLAAAAASAAAAATKLAALAQCAHADQVAGSEQVAETSRTCQVAEILELKGVQGTGSHSAAGRIGGEAPVAVAGEPEQHGAHNVATPAPIPTPPSAAVLAAVPVTLSARAGATAGATAGQGPTTVWGTEPADVPTAAAADGMPGMPAAIGGGAAQDAVMAAPELEVGSTSGDIESTNIQEMQQLVSKEVDTLGEQELTAGSAADVGAKRTLHKRKRPQAETVEVPGGEDLTMADSIEADAAPSSSGGRPEGQAKGVSGGMVASKASSSTALAAATDVGRGSACMVQSPNPGSARQARSADHGADKERSKRVCITPPAGPAKDTLATTQGQPHQSPAAQAMAKAQAPAAGLATRGMTCGVSAGVEGAGGLPSLGNGAAAHGGLAPLVRAGGAGGAMRVGGLANTRLLSSLSWLNKPSAY